MAQIIAAGVIYAGLFLLLAFLLTVASLLGTSEKPRKTSAPARTEPHFRAAA